MQNVFACFRRIIVRKPKYVKKASLLHALNSVYILSKINCSVLHTAALVYCYNYSMKPHQKGART